ncbi:transcriptional regulator PpsR [Palleronia sediminis]|uniref:Transcriptional regulator PpsR n=1 Tax=Palleronia sediminis TaxID=2547833 RepID=A0A4R6A646_9RHOB|nr:transcriptional regulator PpsR [Palleronia sediminis]TDL78222.1 transcriptional regulator PpsR [Palleronia sediminis]
MTSRGAKYWSANSIPLVAPDLLGDIIASASDIALVINDLGTILSVLVNRNHASFGTLDGWQGRDVREILAPESVPKIEKRLVAMSAGEDPERPIELNHADNGLIFPIRYSLHEIGPDGAILMLGRDLRPIAEMQQQLVAAQIALERDYEGQREVETRMRVLMETTADAVVFVSIGTGLVADLNARAAQLLGGTIRDFTGRPIGGELQRDETPVEMRDLIEAGAEDEGPVYAARRTRRPLSVHATAFRASGERMALLRITRPGGQPEQDSGFAARLFENGVDAMVFTDRDGHILSVNEAFLDLVDLDDPTKLRGRPIGDFLARGGVDVKVLSDHAVRNGQLKGYATRLQGAYGTETPVEISVSHLAHAEHPSLGMVIRAPLRAEAGAQTGADREKLKSTRELVGTATLKDIVAETTEVVERMCIETAVELTDNNRVAVAEMLGLSRQSLYVKLRKYNLL